MNNFSYSASEILQEINEKQEQTKSDNENEGGYLY